MSADSPLDRTHLFVDHTAHLFSRPEPGSPRLDWTVGIGANGDMVVDNLVGDLPHLLITGADWAGKTDLVDTMVCQLAHNSAPADLHLWLASYRELIVWAELPHVTRVVDLQTVPDPSAAAAELLDAARQEMERRHAAMAAHPGRPLNIRVARSLARSEGIEDGQRYPLDFPYIVVVIEDVASILSRPALVAERDAWARTVAAAEQVARLARAAGITLVLATPSASAREFGGSSVKQQCRRIGLATPSTIASLEAIGEPGLEAVGDRARGLAVVEGEYRPFRGFQLRWPSDEHPDEPDDRAELLRRLTA